MATLDARMTAIMITHNRRQEALCSLTKLANLQEQVPIIVVDNASSDGTAAAIHECFPAVKVISTGTNLGAAARNLGVERAHTPYVALCDDDTWWEEGSLTRGAELLDSF